MKDPISLRLGDLAAPLLNRCGKTGETPSDLLRKALASFLDEELPEMAQGFAAMSVAKAAKLRKKSAKVRSKG